MLTLVENVAAPEGAVAAEDLSDLIDRAGALDVEVKRKTEELRSMKARLAELAEYKEGSKTGHAFGGRFKITVSLRENVKWDQEALNRLRDAMGDEEFFKVFEWAFEPRSKKLLDGAIEFGRFGEAIKGTFTTAPGAPQVTFKPIEVV
jgi:hypothetical protein